MQVEKRRLFFGFEIEAPWPEGFPNGRLLDEKNRHLTLAFLGNVDPTPLMQALETIPRPPFKIGPVGVFDQFLALPKDQPRVASWHMRWLSAQDEIVDFHARLRVWLENLGFQMDQRPLLSHATIARAPFRVEEWEEAFTPLPFLITGFHLYESTGGLHYPSIWQLPLEKAFEEFEHTADIAFTIRAENLQQLYVHGATALSFKFPPLIDYICEQSFDHLNEVVRALNQLIAAADQERGCPFKAVSYHGQFTNGLWEMIVDV